MSASRAAEGADPPELCIRFSCSACRKPLFVLIRKLIGRTELPCPSCQKTVATPPLDEKVGGYTQLLEAHSIGPQLQTSTKKSSSMKDSDSSLESNQSVPRKTPATAPISRTPGKASASGRPPATERNVSVKVPPMIEERSDALGSDDYYSKEFPDEPDDLPQPIVYGSQPKSQTGSFRRGGGSLQPRVVYRLIYWGLQVGYPAATFLLGLYLQSMGDTRRFMPFLAFAILWFIFGWRFSHWIAFYITPLFVSSIRCPGCQEEYPAVAHHKCSCGFTDHRDRHVLSFKCPKCGSYFGHMNCARCDATILLR